MPSPAPASEPFIVRARRSLTVWWAALLIAIGFGLDAIDLLSSLAGTPEVQDAIKAYAGPYTSHVLKAIGVLTALARMRSLSKGK